MQVLRADRETILRTFERRRIKKVGEMIDSSDYRPTKICKSHYPKTVANKTKYGIIYETDIGSLFDSFISEGEF
jgi:hypothetical protein